MRNILKKNLQLICLAIAGLILNNCAQKSISYNQDCDCGFYTTSGGIIANWPAETELIFQHDSYFPADLKKAFKAAGQSYGEILKDNIINIDPQELSNEPFNGNENLVKGDGINGIYWVQGEWPWKDKNPQSVAMTVVSFNGNKIVEADIFFKADYFSNKDQILTTNPQQDDEESSLFFEPDQSVFDLENSTAAQQWMYVVGIHELGHALGRNHIEDKESIMYYSVNLKKLYSPFNKNDVEIFNKAFDTHNHNH